MKLLIFTDNDLDGAGSALFVKWLFRDKLTEFDVIDTTEATFLSDFKQHESSFNNYDRIFILDLDLSQEQSIFANLNNVIVVDHHIPHLKHAHVYDKAKGIIQQHESCIGLLYEKFGKSVSLTDAQKELIKYVNDYDSYNLKHKDSLKLNAIHKTYNKPKSIKFIEAFEEGTRPYTIQEKNSVKLFIKKLKDQLQGQVFVGKIKNYKTVSIVANYAVSEVANFLINKHGADIGIVVNTDTKTVSLRRSKQSDVDVSVIAKSLCEGGGSPAAAGGNLTQEFGNLTKYFHPC